MSGPNYPKDHPVSRSRSTLSTVSAAEEAALIRSAQLGDASASEALFKMYEPAIHAAAGKFSSRLGMDEALQACALGFMAAVHAFDVSRITGATRLAVLLNTHLVDELWAAMADSGTIAVPARSLRRYFQILRLADGDVQKARALAPQFKMREDTFMSVASAVNPGVSWEVDMRDEAASSRTACVEDQILSKAALDSCSEIEEAVLRLHYGFDDTDGMPLPEVAAQLHISLAKARKHHASGLASAREAVGAL